MAKKKVEATHILIYYYEPRIIGGEDKGVKNAQGRKKRSIQIIPFNSKDVDDMISALYEIGRLDSIGLENQISSYLDGDKSALKASKLFDIIKRLDFDMNEQYGWDLGYGVVMTVSKYLSGSEKYIKFAVE